jgi:hypothetical protein
MLDRYYETASSHLVAKFKQLNKTLKSNENMIVMKGALPDARVKQTELLKT